jgi:hypothetical protein
MVGVQGADIVFLRPVQQRISKADALNLAAHLVTLAEDNPGEFDLLLGAVQSA